MPGHLLDACFVEDLCTAGLLAASCTSLEEPLVGGFAASSDTELAWRMADLARYGVRVRSLTSLELRQHEWMLAHYRALSVADAEALTIARADEAVLLTGDGQMHKAALDAGVDVRGVIGELKRLVAGVIIDPPGALIALESMVASGSRLPRAEVEAARRQWFKMIAKGRAGQLSRELGFEPALPVDFRTITDYLALVVYLCLRLGFAKRDVYQATSAFAALSDELRSQAHRRVFDEIAHSGNRGKSEADRGMDPGHVDLALPPGYALSESRCTLEGDT